MQIQITGKNIDLTEAIKKYINEKIGGLDRYYNKIMDARVEVERCSARQNKNTHRVLVNFHLPGNVLRVEQTEDDIYSAIDFAREEMEAQIKKFKNKFDDKKRKAQKTRRLLKSVLFWRNKEGALDSTEQEENE